LLHPLPCGVAKVKEAIPQLSEMSKLVEKSIMDVIMKH